MLLLKKHIPGNVLTDDYVTGEESLVEANEKMDTLDRVIQEPYLNDMDLEFLSELQLALANRIRLLVVVDFGSHRYRKPFAGT